MSHILLALGLHLALIHAAESPRSTNRFSCGPILDWSNESAEMDQIRQTWADYRFSDPRKHDRRRFTYIVSMAGGPPTREGIEVFRKVITTQDYSASLISDQFPYPLNNRYWGFVLRIPAANVLATTPYDMASNGTSEADLRRKGLHTPESLLFESICGLKKIPRRHVRPHGLGTVDHQDAVFREWNEIRFGGPRAEPTAIEAIVMVPTSLGKKLRREDRRQLVRLAHEMDLPLIKIDCVAPGLKKGGQRVRNERRRRRTQRL